LLFVLHSEDIGLLYLVPNHTVSRMSTLKKWEIKAGEEDEHVGGVHVEEGSGKESRKG